MEPLDKTVVIKNECLIYYTETLELSNEKFRLIIIPESEIFLSAQIIKMWDRERSGWIQLHEEKTALKDILDVDLYREELIEIARRIVITKA